VRSFAAWLTARRLCAQALVLAICLWGVCAVDFATPGPFDRAGNIKFQDFLPTYAAARLISQGHTAEIYDERALAAEMQSAIVSKNIVSPIIGQPMHVRLPYLYGPQVGLLFVPLSKLSFQLAAGIWVTASLAIYFGCLLLIWKSGAPFLASFARSGDFPDKYRILIALAAIAYPPLFHFFMRGQNPAIAMGCFTAAYLAFAEHRDWWAGFALGFLIFKPQFLVAIPFVLLLSFAWRPLAGLIVSASAQIALAWIYFGTTVMHRYIDMLWHAPRWLDTVELSQAAIQMHSLRAFWTLLISWPQAASVLYVTASIAVIAIAASVWRSSAPLALRFSALTLTAVLVNPHLFVYDLLVLAPALLLLANWAFLDDGAPCAKSVLVLSYLAFLLPLFGPLSRWTRVQLSVPVFVALLWIIWRSSQTENATPGHKLASAESHVV
jgi:arabinofuranan 3-O-arabinosyltransferase